MAVQCPCFLVLDSNRWADFLSNLLLPFGGVRVVQFLFPNNLGESGTSLLYIGNIRMQEIFREFCKMRSIYENFLHAKICNSTVVATKIDDLSLYDNCKIYIR